MSMARPAAEIEPNSRIFSRSWILPGPIRPSVSRSMRTLSDGNGAAGCFCIEDLCRGSPGDIATEAISGQNEGPPFKIPKIRGIHELSAPVFTAQGGSLPAQAPRRAGAVDAAARGPAFAGAAAHERRILRAARHARRPAHRRSLAGAVDRLRQWRRTRHL